MTKKGNEGEDFAGFNIPGKNLFPGSSQAETLYRCRQIKNGSKGDKYCKQCHFLSKREHFFQKLCSQFLKQYIETAKIAKLLNFISRL